jgi:hypothetical protein
MNNLLEKYNTAENAEKGAEFELMGLDGKPTGDIIVVRGSDSKTYIAATARFHKAFSSMDEMDDDAKELLARSHLCEFAAKLVVSINGEPIEDCKSLAAELMKAPAVREQIEVASMKREKFVRKIDEEHSEAPKAPETKEALKQ